MRANLIDMGVTTLFIDDMFPCLWEVAVEYGIRPEGMVAQALHETGGRFLGDVKAAQHNTAGIKLPEVVVKMLLAAGIRPDASPRHPLAFTLYFTADNWRVGARVHAEHLKYAWGGAIVPDGYYMIDPRYRDARSVAATKGNAVTWQDLGTRWAPSPEYGNLVWDLTGRVAAARE